MTKTPKSPPPRVHVAFWYVSNLSANMALALLGLITGVVAARLLGPHGRGELAAIQLVALTLQGVALLGLGDSLTYFSSRSSSQRATYVATTMCIAALVSVPFMLISYVAVPYVLVGYSGDVVHAAQLYLVYFLINALLGLPYQVLRVAEHFASWNLLRVLPALSWLLLLIVAWIAGRSDPVWLARSYLVVLALLVVPVAGTMLSLVHGRFVPERSIALPMLRYGLPSSLSAIPQLVTSRVDQIVIAATLTAESMGYYVVALACAGLASPLTSALSALVLPMVALHSDPVERIRVFAKSVRVGIFVAGVTGVVVAVAIPFVLPILFGQSFLPAMAAALVLVGAAALTAVNGVLEEGFRGLGHPEYVLRAHLAGAILGTALVIVLVREYAMIGAAVASLLAAATVAMALLLQGRFLLKLAMMDMVAPRFEELTGVARGMRAALARGLYALKGRVD